MVERRAADDCRADGVIHERLYIFVANTLVLNHAHILIASLRDDMGLCGLGNSHWWRKLSLIGVIEDLFLRVRRGETDVGLRVA